MLREAPGVAPAIPGLIPDLEIPNFIDKMAPTHLKTPSSSQNLNILTNELAKVNPTFEKPAARLLFKKLGKALDNVTVKLATTEARADYLEKALVNAKPQKRRKVLPDPNSTFVNIKAIMKEKERLKAQKIGGTGTVSNSNANPEDNASSIESVAEDYIVVKI